MNKATAMLKAPFPLQGGISCGSSPGLGRSETRDLGRGRPVRSSPVCSGWSASSGLAASLVTVLRTLVVRMGNSSRAWEGGCPVKIMCLCSVILWQTLLTLLRQQEEKLQRKRGSASFVSAVTVPMLSAPAGACPDRFCGYPPL